MGCTCHSVEYKTVFVHHMLWDGKHHCFLCDMRGQFNYLHRVGMVLLKASLFLSLHTLFVQLEKLDLEDCTQVTDVTLIQLACHCAALNTLVLSHCDLITDDGILRLAGGRCGPDNLERIAMDNCPLLTDRSLELLGNACHSLRQVDLYDCQLITKQGIENLKVSTAFVLAKTLTIT